MSQRGIGQKRKRQQADKEKLKQYGIDLPEIPGLPVQVIPLHVFALRKTGAFFRKDASESTVKPFLSSEEDDDAEMQTNEAQNSASAAATSATTASVVDTLMHRVDQAATAETRNSYQERQRKIRLNECRDAIKSWLEALRREMKDRKSGTVLVAAIEHLWGFLEEAKEKVSIRRTCLHLAGHLLEKSAELRRWFLEKSNRLGKWTEMLVNTQQQRETNNNTVYRLFQREGFMLLQHLDGMGYSDVYPRLRVAMQRLEQQFPSIKQDVSSESVAATSMSELRKIRDIALQHSEKEQTVVRRLLDRSDRCMKILVPRFGEDSLRTGEDAVEEKKTGHDDSDNDDDIDWEDGIVGDVNDGVDSRSGAEEQKESHADAVERTLAVMQTAAQMRAGQLEIAFDATTEANAVVTLEMTQAKEKLGLYTKKLRDRHVERLGQWIDALTRADNLIMTEDNGSLLQMESDARQRRRNILESALQLKAQVSSCLSSAQRLVAQSEAETSSRVGIATAPPPALHLLNSQAAEPRSSTRLATVLNRQRPRTVNHATKRSAKIRITYR
eukprot:scaffold4484_cov170-Amphora_coffeaeformis.AAC.7